MSPVFPSAERVAPSSVTGPARGPLSRAGARRCGHVRASRLIRREHEDCACACTRTAGCRPTGDTTARRSGCVTHSCTCTYARESVGALFRRRSVVVSWRQSAPCFLTHRRTQTRRRVRVLHQLRSVCGRHHLRLVRTPRTPAQRSRTCLCLWANPAMGMAGLLPGNSSRTHVGACQVLRWRYSPHWWQDIHAHTAHL